ncbi:MAG: CocE/NonD family hydrolase, partial [Bacillota bacterium]
AYWNSGFWKMLDEIPSRVSIPVYLGESWYDHHLGSALQNWRKLSEDSRRYSTLRIGAWNHSFQPCLEDHRIDHLDNNDTKTAYEWFVKLLKEKTMPHGKVLVYNTGADCWEEKPAYPFPGEKKLTLYLSDERDATRALSANIPPPGAAGYLYDPDNPVRSHGAESLLRNMQDNGSLLQPPPDYRPDVLSFISEPLAGDTTILGRIAAELFVASDAEDTAFTAKVMEVLPNGTARSIRGSITTLAYRGDPADERASYTPGEIVKAAIDMWDVMYTIHQGSRIRVDISSSDFPQYAIHTNTAGIWSLQVKARTAKQTLYFGAPYPSTIQLPLE